MKPVSKYYNQISDQVQWQIRCGGKVIKGKCNDAKYSIFDIEYLYSNFDAVHGVLREMRKSFSLFLSLSTVKICVKS